MKSFERELAAPQGHGPIRMAQQLERHAAEEGIRKVSIPPGKSGPWQVDQFTITEDDVKLENLRMMFNGSGRRAIAPGTYTRLSRNGHLVMTDTRAELSDLRRIVSIATGRVLIVGLGLGVVLQALAEKPEVKSITVVERSEDVVKLVWPTFARKGRADKRYDQARISLIVSDIFTWKPPARERWDVAWFDIWDDICSDNVKEMGQLKRKFSRRVPVRLCWCEMEARRGRWR